MAKRLIKKSTPAKKLAAKKFAPKKFVGKAAAVPDVNALEDVLWFTVLDAAGSLPIHPGCEGLLKMMITRGVQRMHEEGRTDAAAIHEARQSLRHYVTLMKAQAVLLGHPEFLGEDTKKGVDEQLKAGTATPFALWPFWPWK